MRVKPRPFRAGRKARGPPRTSLVASPQAGARYPWRLFDSTLQTQMKMSCKSSNIFVVVAYMRKYNVDHAAASSLQIRDLAERQATAPHAPLCGVVPLRVQPGAGQVRTQ